MSYCRKKYHVEFAVLLKKSETNAKTKAKTKQKMLLLRTHCR